MKRIPTILALACTLGAAAAAGAQPAAQAPAPRDGMLIGFGIGAGEISCEGDGCNDFTEAGGVEFHIGGMLTPRLALMFDLWVMGHTHDNLTITHTIATGAVRYWVVPRLWLQGGLGGASAAYRWDGVFVNLEDRTETVPGVMIGAGYEVAASRTFAIDLQFRAGTGFYGEEDGRADLQAHNVWLGVGFTWF
jgi:hypothetical protein